MTKRIYTEKPTADWNANDFLAYIADRHLAVYGTEYTPPGRNWSLERGLIGSLIGTKGRNPKPRKYEPEVVRAFIDECLRTHRCSPQYPTVSFTWLYKWKTDIWARVLADYQRKVAAAERAKQAESEVEDISDWL
jgi:hypothetical protein